MCIFTETSGDTEEEPTETATLFGAGGTGGTSLGSSSERRSRSTSVALEKDCLRVCICFVHLSYALKHFLYILPPFTNVIPPLSCSTSLKRYIHSGIMWCDGSLRIRLLYATS